MLLIGQERCPTADHGHKKSRVHGRTPIPLLSPWKHKILWRTADAVFKSYKELSFDSAKIKRWNRHFQIFFSIIWERFHFFRPIHLKKWKKSRHHLHGYRLKNTQYKYRPCLSQMLKQKAIEALYRPCNDSSSLKACQPFALHILQYQPLRDRLNQGKVS